MDPQVSGFALGLLFGAAKVLGISSLVLGIAWWRTRALVKRREAEQLQPAWIEERLARLEQGLDYAASQLDQLVRAQTETNLRLSQRAEEGRGKLGAPGSEPTNPR